jgi:hypothetical protein
MALVRQAASAHTACRAFKTATLLEGFLLVLPHFQAYRSLGTAGMIQMRKTDTMDSQMWRPIIATRAGTATPKTQIMGTYVPEKTDWPSVMLRSGPQPTWNQLLLEIVSVLVFLYRASAQSLLQN